MNPARTITTVGRMTIALMTVLISLLLLTMPGWGAEQAATTSADEQAQRLGQRMYREGLLPSGEPMLAYVKGDIPAPGTSFTCVSCHMRSGLGSIEGGVFTTPTNGRTLYQARDLPGAGNNRRNTGMNMAGKKKGVVPVQPPSARPAYSDNSLAEVMRGGRDPSGRILDTIMPRYNLQDKDMDILVAYLKNLANEYSPGVDQYNITFATIITDEVPAEHIEAMMKPLESFVSSANKQQITYEEQLVKYREIRTDQTYRRVKLSRWLLKGAPDTWQSQLEAYYRKEPVFALIGGITRGPWKPVHDFSEAHKLPCILPITDLPVISPQDWYTLYFSKGYFQEGEAAASYLASRDQEIASRKIVQIVRTTQQGRALSEGFMQGLQDKGLRPPVTILAGAEEAIDGARLKQLLEKEKPDILALWTEADILHRFTEDPAARNLPVMLLVSSSYFGSKIWSVPEKLRDVTYIAYPYRLPQDERRYDRLFTADKQSHISEDIRRIQSRTMGTLRVLTQALKELRGDFFRDYLFDTISMMQDLELPLYERLSFGPEQRYASKGCYIVQLSKGEKPELVKRSEWVIH